MGYLENNEETLVTINRELNRIVSEIAEHLQGQGISIIFIAADGVVGKGQEIDLNKLVRFISMVGEPFFTFSVGIGDDLRTAFLSLKYAKSIGRNTTVIGARERNFQVVKLNE